MITDRDIDVLKFINKVGFARKSIIAEICFQQNSAMGKNQVSHRRLTTLFDNGFLGREKDFKYGEYCYFLTKQGQSLLKSNGIEILSNTNRVPWGKFIHDDFAHQVIVKIVRFGGYKFISEKQIKSAQLFGELIPDVCAVHEDQSIYAFEVEFENKTKEKYQARLEEYGKFSNLKKVYYLVPNSSHKSKIESLSIGTTFKNLLNVVLMDEFLTWDKLYV